MAVCDAGIDPQSLVRAVIIGCQTTQPARSDSFDARQIRLSIVIPCFNEAGYLTDAPLSLQQQDFDVVCEVIVVDNNCTDETADIARNLGARVVVEPVAGVCNARHRGTVEARREIVVSTDADHVGRCVERHPDRAETVVAVRETIEGLLALGYRFVTVDELLGVPAYQTLEGRLS